MKRWTIYKKKLIGNMSKLLLLLEKREQNIQTNLNLKLKLNFNCYYYFFCKNIYEFDEIPCMDFLVEFFEQILHSFILDLNFDINWRQFF